MENYLDSGISIIIPAYNEEKSIGIVVSRILDVFSGYPSTIELLVIDDGSEDKTSEVVDENPKARLIKHHGNRGYGAALKTGIRHAQHDLICITDGDGSYPVHQLTNMILMILQRHKEIDMVVGARIGEEVAIPWIRRPAKWTLNILANIIAGEKIPDINSGLRVFKREAILPFIKLLPNGFSFTTTITLALLVNGYFIEYHPIEYYRRIGKSKIRPIRDTLNFVQLILRIALHFAPLKIFLPISGFLFLLAILWGLFSYIIFGRLADSSTLVIAMTAIQVAVVGLLADLFDFRLPNYHKNMEEGRYNERR
jgi:glycosyltransferase involved in cell wall biosynthesis